MGILATIGRVFESREMRQLRKARIVRETERANLAALEAYRRRKLLQEVPESFPYPGPDYFGPWFDRLSEYQVDPNFFPFTSTSGRKRGQMWPLFQNDQQLDAYRMISRNVYDLNNYGKGLMGGLKSYVIHTGFTHRATAKDAKKKDDPAVVKAVDELQDWIDKFVKLNRLPEREQESFIRSKRDGDAFIRHFPQDDGLTKLRWVWPEHVRAPRDDTGEFSFGIRCKDGDVETPLEYAVHDPDNAESDPEIVGADLIDHIKCNVDSGIKRGLPELALDMRDALEGGKRLRRNAGEGAAIQAAIAWVRQHAAATSSQISDFAAGQRDYQRPRVTQEGDRARDSEFIEPGTVLDIDAGQTFVPPPSAENIPGYVAVVQCCLRAAAARWNAPEGLATGDYSNSNFASALVAEAPFRRTCETEQAFYVARWEVIIDKAIAHAVALKQLSPDTIRLAKVQIEPPSLEVRNKLEEMQTNQGYSAMGILSPQTIAQRLGEDWENEQANFDAALARRGPEGQTLPLPGELGGEFKTEPKQTPQFIQAPEQTIKIITPAPVETPKIDEPIVADLVEVVDVKLNADGSIQKRKWSEPRAQ